MNIDEAVHLSRSFGLAFRRCEEQRPLASGHGEMPMVPAIVCAAFSVELGLKALALKEGHEPWGHELATLFGDVSARARASIVARVGVPHNRFDQCLKAASRAFDRWRYVYERDAATVDLAFLRSLQKAVEEELSK